MVVLAIIGLVLAGAAVVCAVWAFLLPRNRSLSRLQSIEAYGFAAPASGTGLADETRSAPISSTARRLGDLFTARFGSARLEELRKLLVQAGLYQTSPHVLLGYRVFATVTLPTLVIVSHAFEGARAVLATVLAAALGWM